jgi:exonuclease III
MSNHTNNNKALSIRIGSLNCRTIFKSYNERRANNLMRYLRLQTLDILACQETSITRHSFTETVTKLQYKFHAHQSIWTTKCVLINNNRNLNMETVKTSSDDRFILAKFTVNGEPDITPFYVPNIYAPASNVDQARIIFYSDLMNFLTNLETHLDIMASLVLLGDFNFSFKKDPQSSSTSCRPKSFMTFVGTHF